MLSEFLPDLMSADSGGHLVCICSSAGLTGVTNMTSYCSTKYALNGLMEAFLQEYSDFDVAASYVGIVEKAHIHPQYK